jgi:hypothetical protein
MGFGNSLRDRLILSSRLDWRSLRYREFSTMQNRRVIAQWLGLQAGGGLGQMDPALQTRFKRLADRSPKDEYGVPGIEAIRSH